MKGSVTLPETDGPTISRRQLSVRQWRLHEGCDALSGQLIYVMVVFSPWAFGTTQAWSIWTMNCLAYLLGILLAGKLALRQFTGHRPARWGQGKDANARLSSLLLRILALMTVLLLAYCLTGVINARSTYHHSSGSFEYHRFISWLPNSHDRIGGWLTFCNYFALALSFWAIRDWLLGKSVGEQRAERISGSRPNSTLPDRWRRLLWILCLNGGLLALEGIIQRVDGTNKLLFFMETRINKTAPTQFGPYAYRSNAAQYFNLVWPVCLGLWWSLRQSLSKRTLRLERRDLLLACGILMAAAPIISSTRGGAIVDILELLLVSVAFGPAARHAEPKAKAGLLLFVSVALGLGFWLGWSTIAPRFEPATFQNGLDGRNQITETAWQIAVDYPVFGTGPGTFEPLFSLYRIDPNEYWPAQLHNDWLQTLITFGWVGSLMIGLALACVAARPLIPGGIAGRSLPLLLWISVGGCLLHARYDFPFQIYSVMFLFLLCCAMLSCLSRTHSAPVGNNSQAANGIAN
ncbi:MAG: O-antigen ligase family protein [Verrucomicrobiota bacterium]